MNTTSDQEKLNEQLQNIENYLRSILKIHLAQALSEVKSDPKLAIVYGMTGKNKREEIVNATGISAGKISGIWKEWEMQGLINKEGSQFVKVLE